MRNKSAGLDPDKHDRRIAAQWKLLRAGLDTLERDGAVVSFSVSEDGPVEHLHVSTIEDLLLGRRKEVPVPAPRRIVIEIDVLRLR